jgi:hypothetical protein
MMRHCSALYQYLQRRESNFYQAGRWKMTVDKDGDCIAK